MSGVNARLVETIAADGSTLYDVVVDRPGGDETVIYRGIELGHVDSVRADVSAGRLDPLDVQKIFRETVLARSGRPQPVFIRGVPIPLSWGKGKAGDRWAEAQRRIEALRTKA